jgi:hypothetical protein
VNRSVFQHAAAALLPLALTLACSGGGDADQAAPPQPTDTAPAADTTPAATTLAPIPQDLLVDLQRLDEVQAPDIPAGARYLVTLCALDLTAAATADDPGAAFLALLDTVPTDDEAQQQELATIRAGFAAGLSATDPLRSPELLQATALLRMRCN